jgi:hypothetical protein
VHLFPQQSDTLLVNDLKIGHELLRQFADRSHGDVNPVMTGELDPDFFTLTTFHKPRQADVGDHVVSDVTARSDDALEFL